MAAQAGLTMIAFLRRRGMLKGVLGGNRYWTAIWVGTAVLGLIKRFAGDKPEVVYREELAPGSALIIKAEDLPPRT